jgi:hypothetical protein
MRRKFKKVGLIALAALTVVSFAPLISLTFSLLIADVLGCAVDEGAIHVCHADGYDLGSALNIGTMMGWLLIFTWPECLFASPLGRSSSSGSRIEGNSLLAHNQKPWTGPVAEQPPECATY